MATKKNYSEADAQGVKAPAFCAYVGPTLMGIIQNGTVFSKSKKEVLKELAPVIERFPLVAKLIVEGDNLAEAKVNVKRPGNIMYVNYHKLASGKF